MIDFEIENATDSIAVVKVRGDLNESTREYFFDCVSDLLGSEENEPSQIKNVIIECHGLGYLSSSGIAALVSSRSNAQKRGTKVYLTHLNSTITSVLEITNLNSLLGVYPTTEELLKKLGAD